METLSEQVQGLPKEIASVINRLSETHKIIANGFEIRTPGQYKLFAKKIQSFNDGADEFAIEKIEETFTLWKTVDIVISDGYLHQRQLANFAEKYRSKFLDFDKRITDDNFANVSDKLLPGKKYVGKFWNINKVVKAHNILCHLVANKVLRTAAQGLTIAWEQKSHEFPISKEVLSFDKDWNLPFFNEGRRVPYIKIRGDANLEFNFNHFESDYGSCQCLFGLCEC